jgi:hypothetical protein
VSGSSSYLDGEQYGAIHDLAAALKAMGPALWTEQALSSAKD